jgi:hypothetical protein
MRSALFPPLCPAAGWGGKSCEVAYEQVGLLLLLLLRH